MFLRYETSVNPVVEELGIPVLRFNRSVRFRLSDVQRCFSAGLGPRTANPERLPSSQPPINFRAARCGVGAETNNPNRK